MLPEPLGARRQALPRPAGPAITAAARCPLAAHSAPRRRRLRRYSSEDIGGLAGDRPLYVYYCRHSGKHALTTDCNLATVPRRRTDHALVLDTQEHLVKLYTTDGGAKLLRRK